MKSLRTRNVPGTRSGGNIMSRTTPAVLRELELTSRVETPTKTKTLEATMPVILWLLGVPFSLLVVLWLFGVFS